LRKKPATKSVTTTKKQHEKNGQFHQEVPLYVAGGCERPLGGQRDDEEETWSRVKTQELAISKTRDRGRSTLTRAKLKRPEIKEKNNQK